jgi:hypothetical protein
MLTCFHSHTPITGQASVRTGPQPPAGGRGQHGDHVEHRSARHGPGQQQLEATGADPADCGNGAQVGSVLSSVSLCAGSVIPVRTATKRCDGRKSGPAHCFPVRFITCVCHVLSTWVYIVGAAVGCRRATLCSLFFGFLVVVPVVCKYVTCSHADVLPSSYVSLY